MRVLECVCALVAQTACVCHFEASSQPIHPRITLPVAMSVEIIKGSVIKCDEVMKTYIHNLEEKNALGGKFILQDLGATGLFVKSDAVQAIKAEIYRLQDQNTFEDGLLTDVSGREKLPTSRRQGDAN